MATQTDAVNRLRQGILAQRVLKIPENALPGRWLLHAGPGWGKTSFAAQFPKVIFMQSPGESGLQTLIDYGQVPPTPFLPEATSWAEAFMYVRALREEDHDYKTLAIDTINGLELLARTHVMHNEFDGSERDFAAYGKGAEIVAGEWNKFLAEIDRLRAERRMVVLLLCHTKIKTFNNPTGSNYDRYTPEISDKLFLPTYKWVDGALFGALETQILTRKPKENQKVKVSADVQSRILYTEETAAWSAKNRHGLPPEVECGESAAHAYREFTKELKAGRDRMRAALANASKEITPTMTTGGEKASAAVEAPGETVTGHGSGTTREIPDSAHHGQQDPPTQKGGLFGVAPGAAAEQTAGSANGSNGTGGAPVLDEAIPDVVRAIWGRMANREAVKDELAALRAALMELLGTEKGRVEYDATARLFGGKDETNPGVAKRVALELWKAVQKHTEQAEVAA